uniref:Uncharacterized protein n=1 Tax=Poecilia formosa TaxID=48698 RepID=A0A096MG86_POEFO
RIEVVGFVNGASVALLSISSETVSPVVLVSLGSRSVEQPGKDSAKNSFSEETSCLVSLIRPTGFCEYSSSLKTVVLFLSSLS